MGLGYRQVSIFPKSSTDMCMIRVTIAPLEPTGWAGVKLAFLEAATGPSYQSKGTNHIQPAIRVVHMVSHPIQYYAPLYRELARRPEIDLTVMFYSVETAAAFHDQEFDRTIRWDVPMLDGYKYVIAPSAKTRKVVLGFDLRPSFDVLRQVQRSQFDVLWVSGYQFLNTWLLAALGLSARYTIFLHDEQNLLTHRAGWKRAFKRLLLPLLFRRVWGLYIGQENRRFLHHYGIPEERLFPAHYCVDNAALRAQRSELLPRRAELRAQFGILDDGPVILFSGKLIDKKQPGLLLRAFRAVRQASNCHLLFVGDGHLRSSLEEMARDLSIPDVHWVGFLNQSRIAEAYVAADVFVLPSAFQETWGLVVNEAMNFELPILVSDQVGCAKDLVQHGENGFVFPSGKVQALTKHLALLVASPASRRDFGLRSAEIVSRYSIESCATQVVQACLAASTSKMHSRG